MKPRLTLSSLFSQGRDGQEILLPQLFECVVLCLNLCSAGDWAQSFVLGRQAVCHDTPSQPSAHAFREICHIGHFSKLRIKA